MQAGDALPLRDIHAATAPPWWPPAPGWWMVLAAAILLLACFAWWRHAVRVRRRALARLFDEAVGAADTPAERVAAVSELLRRAARRKDPDADRLQGDDWLRFLDRGMKQPVFSAGAGALLRDGAYRRELSQAEFDALRDIARTRFLAWMERRR